jgi:hypothetical protein
MLTDDELAECSRRYYESNIDPELVQRKFMEVNGLSLLEWRDAPDVGTDSMGKLIAALEFVIRHSDSLTPSDIQRMQAILAEVTGDKQC